jgi:AcrR family transcriptional regulator
MSVTGSNQSMAPVPLVGDGEARKQACRNEEILKVATRMFAEYGYRSTDVEFIAKELGIGKGTIYRNFSSKQQLFFATLDRGLEQLHAHMTKVFEQDLDPIEKLKEATREYFKFFEENPDLVELFIQERAEFRDRPQFSYFEHKERNVSRACGLFNELASSNQIDLKAFDDVFSSLFFGTLFVHYFSRRQKPLSARAEDIINLILMNILKPNNLESK